MQPFIKFQSAGLLKISPQEIYVKTWGKDILLEAGAKTKKHKTQCRSVVFPRGNKCYTEEEICVFSLSDWQLVSCPNVTDTLLAEWQQITPNNCHYSGILTVTVQLFLLFFFLPLYFLKMLRSHRKKYLWLAGNIIPFTYLLGYRTMQSWNLSQLSHNK